MKCMMNRMAIIAVLFVSLGLAMVGRDVSAAETPAEFYRGKTLIWIFAGGAGSSGDVITRTIAPFLAKEIDVRVKVENKKTDEGINYLYSKGTRDGLALATKDKDSIIGNEILKAPGVQYETDKFNFVADVYPSIKTFQISPKLPYKTLDALRKAKGLRAGATSAKGSFAVSGAVMLDILGLDGKVITGYPGKKDLILAVARGEIDFIVSSDGTAMKDEKDGYIVNLFAVGDKRSAAVPQTPSLTELGFKVSKEMVPVYKFIASGGLAVVLPPGVPQGRIEYLRKAFQSLNNNQELQKQMEKLTGNWRAFVSGQEPQQEMAEIKTDKELATKLDAVFKKYSAVR